MAVNKDGVYIAEDRDFQSINGSWVYKGEPLEVDITEFVNSKNLTSTQNMFRGSSPYESKAVTRVVLGENSVINMSYMFNSSQATSLDLSNFDTSSVTIMFSMFESSKATSLDLSSFDTSSVPIMSYMFTSSQARTGYAKTQADADRFNSSSNKPSGLVFVVKRVNENGVYIAEDRDFQSINGYWIYKGGPLEVDITEFVNSKDLTSTRHMFNGSSPYESTAVTRVVLGRNSLTEMNFMFSNSQATSLDLSSFDISSETIMSYMFHNSQATSLDLSGFDTSSVANMFYMFQSSQATTGYARTQADADRFNSSSGKPSGLVFVVKQSFGTLNNLKINSMSYKDSNGVIKQVQTLKYKNNLGNITKLK